MVDASGGRSITQKARHLRIDGRIDVIQILAPGLEAAPVLPIAKVKAQTIGIGVVDEPVQLIVRVLRGVPIGIGEPHQIAALIVVVAAIVDGVAALRISHAETHDAASIPAQVNGTSGHLGDRRELTKLVVAQVKTAAVAMTNDGKDEFLCVVGNGHELVKELVVGVEDVAIAHSSEHPSAGTHGHLRVVVEGEIHLLAHVAHHDAATTHFETPIEGVAPTKSQAHVRGYRGARVLSIEDDLNNAFEVQIAMRLGEYCARADVDRITGAGSRGMFGACARGAASSAVPGGLVTTLRVLSTFTWPAAFATLSAFAPFAGATTRTSTTACDDVARVHAGDSDQVRGRCGASHAETS